MIWEKYRPGYRPYREFRAAGRLIESVLDVEDVKARGSKFSCFELVEAASTAQAAPATAEALAVAGVTP